MAAGAGQGVGWARGVGSHGTPGSGQLRGCHPLHANYTAMKWLSDSGGQVRTCWQQRGRSTGLRGGSRRRRPGGHLEPERPGKGATSGVWDGAFSGARSEGPSCPSSLSFSHVLRGGHSAGPASSTANPPLGLWPLHPYQEEQLTEGSLSSCRGPASCLSHLLHGP